MNGEASTDQATEVDVITFEVLRHRLWEINDEMALMVGRISGAPSVYESGDFNVAILTSEGQGLYTGVYVIRQASALDIVVQRVIEMFGDDIHDGDAFMTSDPSYGALHALAAAVVMPALHPGARIPCPRLVAPAPAPAPPRPRRRPP